MENRKKFYQVLDIITVVAGCVFVGAKVGQILIRKCIRQAKEIEG